MAFCYVRQARTRSGLTLTSPEDKYLAEKLEVLVIDAGKVEVLVDNAGKQHVKKQHQL